MDGGYDVLLRALRAAYGHHLKTVVLFGSRARGEASAHSDHDIFAVIEGLPADPMARARETRMTLIDCLADLPGPIGLHAKTPAEFEADLTPLYLDVCADGICLFGSDYFEPFRRKCLTALASSGMKRERVGRTLFWMLPGNGPKNWELTWEGYRELP
ncbi:MAG: nucleotidyltransferase domain-containing protein [Bacteroidota bacterium]